MVNYAILGQLRIFMTSRYDVTSHIFFFICINLSVLSLHVAIQNRSIPSHFSGYVHAPLMLFWQKPGKADNPLQKGMLHLKNMKKTNIFASYHHKIHIPPSPPKTMLCFTYCTTINNIIWIHFQLNQHCYGGEGGHIDIFGLFKKCNISFATDCGIFQELCCDLNRIVKFYPLSFNRVTAQENWTTILKNRTIKFHVITYGSPCTSM